MSDCQQLRWSCQQLQTLDHTCLSPLMTSLQVSYSNKSLCRSALLQLLPSGSCTTFTISVPLHCPVYCCVTSMTLHVVQLSSNCFITHDDALYQHALCPPAASCCGLQPTRECVMPFHKLIKHMLTLLYRQACPTVEHTNGLFTHMQRQAHTWLPSGIFT